MAALCCHTEDLKRKYAPLTNSGKYVHILVNKQHVKWWASAGPQHQILKSALSGQKHHPSLDVLVYVVMRTHQNTQVLLLNTFYYTRCKLQSGLFTEKLC